MWCFLAKASSLSTSLAWKSLLGGNYSNAKSLSSVKKSAAAKATKATTESNERNSTKKRGRPAVRKVESEELDLQVIGFVSGPNGVLEECDGALKLFLNAKIMVVGLPSHTSADLQPLDVAVFKAVKNASSQLYRDEMLENYQFEGVMDIQYWDLPQLLYKAFVKGATPENCASGFRSTGIWPLQINWCEKNQEKIIPSMVCFKAIGESSSAGSPFYYFKVAFFFIDQYSHNRWRWFSRRWWCRRWRRRWRGC